MSEAERDLQSQSLDQLRAFWLTVRNMAVTFGQAQAAQRAAVRLNYIGEDASEEEQRQAVINVILDLDAVIMEHRRVHRTRGEA